jgi:hypothetical protein
MGARVTGRIWGQSWGLCRQSTGRGHLDIFEMSPQSCLPGSTKILPMLPHLIFTPVPGQASAALLYRWGN